MDFEKRGNGAERHFESWSNRNTDWRNQEKNWEECSDVADELIENNAALRYVETPAEQVNQPHLLLRVELHVWSSDVYITAVTCLCYSEQLDSDKTLVSHIVGPLSINCQNFNCLKLFAEDSSSIWKTVTRGESICPSVL